MYMCKKKKAIKITVELVQLKINLRADPAYICKSRIGQERASGEIISFLSFSVLGI